MPDRIKGWKKVEYIAYCGLDCETCEVRIATIKDDDVLRRLERM